MTVSEHLPGEPLPPTWSAPAIARELARKALILASVALVALPLWPFYLALRLVLGRPPNVPRADRFVRFLRYALVAPRPAPGIRPLGRLALGMTLIQRWIAVPLSGLAWQLDELLYGRALRAVRLDQPIFEVSAARSGSTQLAHYLEDDPQIEGPSLLRTFFPYLWLWRFASATLGRFVSEARVRKLVLDQFPAAHHERHEMDPFRTDSFEVVFMTHHLGDLALSLGPDALAEFEPGRLTAANRGWWEDDFVRFLDGVARKTVLAGGRRLLVKGHFLAAADLLAARYPDARFLTVLRAPDQRIRSAVNFLRAHAVEPLCGPSPWAWLGQYARTAEVAYCDAELAWIARMGERVCVVPFRDYVRDLEGTMRRVYHACLDAELSPHVPRTHAPRVRSDYSIDRTLADVGIDAAWLRERLAPYYAACEGRDRTGGPTGARSEHANRATGG